MENLCGFAATPAMLIHSEYLIDHLEETMEMYMWNLIRGTEEYVDLLKAHLVKQSENNSIKQQYQEKITRAQEKIDTLKNLITPEKVEMSKRF